MILHDRVITDPKLPADDPNRFHRSALSEHDVARIVGDWSFTTWRGKRAAERKAFKARVPSLTTESDKLDVYDPEQVAAYVDPAKEMPHLITQDADLPDEEKHPDDLLTDYEAAAHRGIAVTSLRENMRHGHITGWVEVAGMRFWPRHALTPGKAGRPYSVEEAVEEVKKWIAAASRGERGPVTASEIKAAFNISQATADRYLARVRQATDTRPSPAQAAAQIRQWLDAAERGERDTVTYDEIKETFGISQATAERYLARAREDDTSS